MVISDFKKLVADYMNRESSIFDSGSPSQVDKLLLGANNAKKFAQRRMLFELARCTVDVIIDKDTGGALSSAVLHDDGVTPVNVQTLERAFIPTSDGLSLTPVDLIDRDAQYRQTKRRVENVHDPRNRNIPNFGRHAQIVRHGTKVFVQNWDNKLYTTQTIKAAFDVVAWMTPYGQSITGTITQTTSGLLPGLLIDSTKSFIAAGVKPGDLITDVTQGFSFPVAGVNSPTQVVAYPAAGTFFTLGDVYTITSGVQEDFFINDCVDWMLYRTIQELNLFLKEDQRVSISNSIMEKTWETVVTWNSRLEYNADDLDLE